MQNDLLKMKLFSLLSEPSQVTNQDMQNAYECFMEQVENTSQSEQIWDEIYRKLNIRSLFAKKNIFFQTKICSIERIYVY
jgi:hypothetical protein